ncbi:MAG TPA: site-2 protease family protein [Bacillota bacterium]|nr:site-2 protease family protein [Bacillota bacterium]
MNLRKFIPSVQIHPILMIFIIISFVTGTFVELSVILLIVLFHELGHFMMAAFFNWRIKSVMLWVFGGVMDTEEHASKPLHEEVLVIIAGPFQHIIVYVLVFLMSSLQLFSSSIIDLLLFYNTVLLCFNLLPIWPLDGGKLLFSILSIFFPYKRAFTSVIIFSIIVTILCIVVQLFIIPFTLSSLLVVMFLLMENRTEWKQRFYVFIRFLLKRFEDRPPPKLVQPIIVSHQASLMDVFNEFKRDRSHPIYVTYSANKRKSIDEMECLRSYFYNKHYNKSIGEIVDLIA